ncbi:hypothetical protein K490DRAFT_68918 [Saccharata proteae CBS 121410]|uniref:Uncharacterized protein n=1 Tax=Saccharata proteae CBS 121410 TaxID=1314787 RepID=A0A9P4HMF0_9PEZI|nr:hypothetical protein K490DRAFT_68918 [Saccharata proteae CBS 121410]
METVKEEPMYQITSEAKLPLLDSPSIVMAKTPLLRIIIPTARKAEILDEESQLSAFTPCLRWARMIMLLVGILILCWVIWMAISLSPNMVHR